MQQTSFTAVPLASPPKMIPLAMSFMVFGQYMGGSIFISISNAIFSSKLKTALPEYAPGVNTTAVIAAGASADYVRSIVSPELLPGVLKAYSVSIDNVIYMATACSGALFLTSFFTGWVDTRAKKEEKKSDPELAQSTVEGTGTQLEAEEEKQHA